MALLEELSPTLPQVAVLRSRLRGAPEEIPMEPQPQRMRSVSTLSLPNLLRRRTAVEALDEENRLENLTPITVDAASEPGSDASSTSGGSLLERPPAFFDVFPSFSLKEQSEPKALIRKETQKFFDKIVASTPCVFLCWGRPDDCRIIQVPVGEGGTWSFQDLNDAWFTARGRWRRWLPVFGIVSVEQVQIQFAGCLTRGKQDKTEVGATKKKDDDEPQATSRNFSTYFGIYNSVPNTDNIESLEKELLKQNREIDERARNCEHARDHDIRNIMNEEYGEEEEMWPCDICPIANADYVDEDACPVGYSPGYNRCDDGKCQKCDEGVRDNLFDRIANARRRSMLSLCFRYPSLDVAPHIAFSSSQVSLPDIVGVVTQQGLLKQLTYGGDVCRISNIALSGLVVHEEWLDWRESVLLPLVVGVFFALVVGARFLFGDWQTGLTAGGCFLAALTIPVLWASHAVRR